MSGPFGFDPTELGATDGHELEHALEAVRALQLAAEDAPVGTGGGFSNRIMTALADEPSPAIAGFLAPLRRRGVVTGFAESVRQAWASIGTARPPFARATALAYVLAVAIAGVSLAGAAAFGAAGALGLLAPSRTEAPTSTPSTAPLVTPAPTSVPSEAPSFAPTTSPSESPQASDGIDDHGGGTAPEPSDDNSGTSGSGGGGGSDDGSSGGSGPSATDDQSGSGGGTSTPRPTATPKPSETPH